MPNFDVCYVDRSGSLIGKISMKCAGPKEAAILAHAMKFRKWLRVEVWEGDELIYRRPTAHASERPTYIAN
jgi:hypothetical protein